MANNFVNLAIYQINSHNEYNPEFPIYRDFPIGGLVIRDVSPPLNVARGVLCYGAVRSWAHGNREYYTDLSMAQVIALANTVSNGLSTEAGVILTDESGNVLTTEQ